MSLLGEVEFSEPQAASEGFLVVRISIGLTYLPGVEVYARNDGIAKVQLVFQGGTYLERFRSGDSSDEIATRRFIRREIAQRAYNDGNLIDEVMALVDSVLADLLKQVSLLPVHE